MPTIRAEVHSDDYRYTAKFDATPWFKRASEEEIIALHECDWGGDWAADYVALFFNDKAGCEDVSVLFAYVRKVDGIGFECTVHDSDALNWLYRHRPVIFHRILEGDEAGCVEDPPAAPATPHWDRDRTWGGEYQRSDSSGTQ